MHRTASTFAVLFAILAPFARCGDFNKDGFDDVATGAPLTTVAGLGGKYDGAVYVAYGSASGFDPLHLQTIIGADVGLEQSLNAQESAEFGCALATGDFDHDGFDDLAVGARGATVDGIARGGAVVVIPGSAGGLVPSQAVVWSQNTPGIKDRVETWTEEGTDYVYSESFGVSVAAGNFDGDKFDDLAVGVLELVGDKTSAGGVQVLYGSKKGLSAKRDRLFTQKTKSVKGKPGTFELFGYTLASADFDRDGNDDLVVTAPMELNEFQVQMGTVHVFYGDDDHGLTASRDQLFLPPNLESDQLDYSTFGGAIAAGDFDGDSFPDLAVSTPAASSSTLGSNPPPSIWIYRGGKKGLKKKNPMQITQIGFNLLPLPPGNFANALTAADFDGDGRADLALGCPTLEVKQGVHGGGVFVIRGSATGLTPAGVELWSQETVNIDLTPEAGAGFGWTLAHADVNGDDRPDLLVAAPNWDTGWTNLGVVHCIHAQQGVGLTNVGDEVLFDGVFPLPPGYGGFACFGRAIGE